MAGPSPERKKRCWEIVAALALVAALAGAMPVWKAMWERWQQKRDMEAYLLRQATGGYYPDLHGFAEEARELGVARAAVASPADALCLAVSAGDTDHLAALLRGGADPNATTTARANSIMGRDIAYTGVTPLWLAAGYGDLAAVKLLLAKGARAETTDSVSWLRQTALMRAAAAGSDQVVELLLRGGASIERRDGRGCTALWHAAETGQAAVLRVLIRHGAKVDVPAGKPYGNEVGGPRTPLQWAAEYGHTEAARVLLEAGAARNPRAGGGTPLSLAEKAGHPDTARLLRSNGCTR